MTPDQTTKPKKDPAALARLLDAATVLVGIAAASAGVALFDPRLGLVTFGGLLLGAEVVASLLRR